MFVQVPCLVRRARNDFYESPQKQVISKTAHQVLTETHL